MKAVVVSSPGGPEVLEVERQKPILKAGWTLVKIQGFGINHSEILPVRVYRRQFNFLVC